MNESFISSRPVIDEHLHADGLKLFTLLRGRINANGSFPTSQRDLISTPARRITRAPAIRRAEPGEGSSQ